MEYIKLLFLGITTFISPCMLPMVPIFLAYFAGENKEDKKQLYIKTLLFIFGFSTIFVAIGVFASFFSGFIGKNKLIIDIVFGLFLILFGLNFLDVFKIDFLNKSFKIKKEIKTFTYVSSFLFGLMFAFSWTPCITPLLGVAIENASKASTVVKGGFELFVYSLGMGIPMFLSAIFLNKLKTGIKFISKHYDKIMKGVGLFLTIYGILIISGII